jgi:hypothetical protein
MKILLILGLLALCGCATHRHSDVVDRKSRAYVQAMADLGEDAGTAFKKQLERGNLAFLAIGEHPFRENCSFPGLAQDEVDAYITRKKVPFQIRFDSVAPVIVTKNGESYDYDAYWAAVDDFLTTYNRLVLAELKRRETRPNQTLEPTDSTSSQQASAAVTPAPAGKPPADPSRRSESKVDAGDLTSGPRGSP